MSDSLPSTPAVTVALRPPTPDARRLVVLAVLAVGLIVAMLTISLQLLADLEQRASLVTHSLDVQRQAELLQTEVRGAGRQVLDMLASGDAAAGIPLSAWKERIEAQASDLRALVSDDPSQSRRAADLQTALKTHLSYLAGLLIDRGEERQSLLVARRASAQRLEVQIAAFVAEESRLLAEREAAWSVALTRQAVSVALMGALALAALASLLWMWRRLTLQRAATLAAEHQHALALAGLNAGLETQVRERTDSLERSAAALAEARERLARLARDLLVVSESERRTLAHALHDDFGQRLAALKINLQLMRSRQGVTDALAAEAIRITDGCIAEVRSQAFALRPPQLDELGLAAALRAHVLQEAARHGVQADLRLDLSEVPQPDAWSIQVYRIVQEAVRNAMTHGRPHRIEVGLQRDRDAVVLCIADDGSGSNPVEGATGMGLLHMRERAELSGGRFTTRSRQPGGTEVRCEWPLDAMAAETGRIDRE